VGRPEICDDPRFDSIATRSRNVVALYELAGAALAEKTTAEWLALLRQLEIPSAQVSDLDELMRDPQLAAGGFFKRTAHPSEGDILFTDQPVRFGDTAASNPRLQPRLGEHSIEILREAGLAETAIEALLESGATVDSNRKAQAAELNCRIAPQ
jgi:crotonobetainyl-CoA:carnitine CoA-transferase CaiB-like acyl-CoA transferase